MTIVISTCDRKYGMLQFKLFLNKIYHFLESGHSLYGNQLMAPLSLFLSVLRHEDK